MQYIALLLSALATGPLEDTKVPTGTFLSIQATVCHSADDIHKIVDAEINFGTGREVFASLGGCNNFCIKALVIRETRRFTMRDQQLYAIFELKGLNVLGPTLWAATAIEPTGWPISVLKEVHEDRCEK